MARGDIRCAVRVLTATFILGLATTGIQAASITATASPLGGSVWRYEFALSSFSAGAASGFTIYFPLAEVTSLTAPAASADWDPIIFDPDSPPGTDGAFDALALVAAPGLGPFSVDAMIAGLTAPLVLRFEIYEANASFNILERGFTGPPGQTVIPEPASAVLFLLGAIAAFMATPGARFRSIGRNGR